MKVLHVISDLEYHGAARQLTLLCQGLPRPSVTSEVIVLGPEGPLATPLRAAGITVHVLNGLRSFDPRMWWRLRCLVRSIQPDVVHAWRLPALRALALARGRFRWPVVINDALPPGVKPPALALGDRWLLKRARWVVARHPFEVEQLTQVGLSPQQVALVPLAVPMVGGGALGKEPHPAGPQIVFAGPLLPHRGFRIAVWAMHILHYAHPKLRLLVVGDGPDRAPLERFTYATSGEKFIHFLGTRGDLPELFACADIVWVPSLAQGGGNVALEAMALGRPVVASALPDLAALVEHERTGLLYPPGDKLALARCTRRLLLDPKERQGFGDAGRQHAQAHFSLPAMVQRVNSLYDRAVA